MPTISSFSGIVIKMYFQQSEHNPPHVHAIYAGKSAAINIRTCEVLEGGIPPAQLSMAITWVKANKDALLAIWESQTFQKLPPL